MIGAVLASVCAVLAIGAIALLAASRTRVAGVIAFAAAGLFGGVAAIAMNADGAGGALIGATAVLSAMAFATGPLVGEIAESGKRWPRLVLGVATAAMAAVFSAWGLAPAWTAPPANAGAPAFALARAGDLFIALVVLVGVAGAGAAILGFGERGVLGGGGKE